MGTSTTMYLEKLITHVSSAQSFTDTSRFIPRCCVVLVVYRCAAVWVCAGVAVDRITVLLCFPCVGSGVPHYITLLTLWLQRGQALNATKALRCSSTLKNSAACDATAPTMVRYPDFRCLTWSFLQVPGSCLARENLFISGRFQRRFFHLCYALCKPQILSTSHAIEIK